MSPRSSSVIAPQFAVQNFLNEEVNLETMTYLSLGLSYRAIAKKVGTNHSFVQDKSRFLRDYAMMVRGRWNIDVQALGMTKTVEFYDFTEESWSEIMKRNFYLSYLSQVMMGKMKYLAMYTFPEEVRDRIGSEITSWYYTFPHFNLPFFKNGSFEKEFWRIFEEENNENPLPPRGERIKNPDLIDIYICRFVQTELEDINLRKYTRRMEEEIGDIIDVHYSTVRTKFQRLREKHVIFPSNPINLTEASYVHLFCITSYNQIFRFMKSLDRLNILVAISFMKDGRNILYIHGPYDKQNNIANILSQLDKESQMFSVTNLQVNRGLPYKHYLEENRKKK